MRELTGQLIVTQTPENHRQLVALLEQLREVRAIQVTIEARFLTVQRNFLEDIGVDFDFSFNTGNDPLLSNVGPITVQTGAGAGSLTRSYQSAFTRNATTAAPGSIGAQAPQGLGFGLSTFMDDFSANLLVRATQATVNSTIVTAPRVTLFNGQRAYVLVSTEQAYVSDLTPVVASGVGIFDPTIDIISSGVLLDVTATVSADRKYVTLTLRPQLSQLIQLVPFAFQTATTSQGATGGGTTGGGTTVISTGGGVAGTGIIQQPIIQITEVRTTVSVPDGGTLLLGGETIAGETEREVGVPILSKIPFLKRLFTNRSMAKDEQVLLILVKPTIIITREVEEKAFPLLSSRVGGQ